MSAYDPKRTLLFSPPTLPVCSFDLIRCLILSLGGTNHAYRAISRPEAILGFRTVGLGHQYPRLQLGLRSGDAPDRGPMLDAADVKHGKRVLDVCCGPGMLAAGALERNAEVIGLDFAAEAVELARKLVPNGQFQQGDAQALPFPAASFDAVLCGYGLMHLPEPATALREILRVLRPDGRASLSVWDLTGAGFTLVYEAVRARGSMDMALPHGPDFFQFGSPERMRAGLEEAGFVDAADILPPGLARGRRGSLHRIPS